MRILLLLLLVFTACAPAAKRTGRELKIGAAMPKLHLENLAGQAVFLESLRGQPLMVNFWGVWCAPCIAEIPVLKELQEQNKARGLKIIGVDVKDTRVKLDDFLSKNPLNYETWVQGEKTDNVLDTLRLWQSFENNSAAIPYTIGIGRDGLVKGIVGGFDIDGQALRNLVQVVLKE